MGVAILPKEVFHEALKYIKGFHEPDGYSKDPNSRFLRGGTSLKTRLPVVLKSVDNFQSRISGKHVYRYQQVCKVDGREIPIYGSSVVAEAKNREITFSSAQVDKKVADAIFQTPSDLKIKDEWDLKEALYKVLGEVVKEIDLNPTLYYYYDVSHKQEGKWRLVWVTNIPTKEFERIKGEDFQDFLSKLADYIVDAKSGEIVRTLSHVRS